MNNVNIIYLTSKCNFDCEYCYERLGNKEQITSTFEQLKNNVDIILEREKEGQVLFVLFGGEPTLEFESIKFVTEYALSKREDVIFNITSNGWVFQSDSFIKKYKELKAYKLGRLYLDISFDGVGNFRRKLKNGLDTTPYTIKVLKKLKEVGIRYRIRYTIHKGNIDYVQEDIPKIVETFKPERVITSINYAETPVKKCLENIDFDEITQPGNLITTNGFQEVKNGKIFPEIKYRDLIGSKKNIDKLDKFRESSPLNNLNFDDVFKRTGVSICNFTCNVCNRCANKDGYTYLQDGIIREKPAEETKELFTDFKEIK